jgi:hypothetical protein
MHTTALVTLNMRELDRLKVVQAAVEMGLKPGRAAERLGLTVRQVERWVTRYRDIGPDGVWAMPAGATQPVLRWQIEDPRSRLAAARPTGVPWIVLVSSLIQAGPAILETRSNTQACSSPTSRPAALALLSTIALGSD